MDAIESIISRKVQRAFAPTAVEDDKLVKIVEAGRHAMSARNLQPWQFVVVRDRAHLKAIGEFCTTGKFVADAPCAVIVLKDLSNTRWADVDCAQAVQNMANAGWALGLGTCWVGNFDAAKIGPLIDLPAGWGIFTILPFGYSDAKRPPEARPLKPRGAMVHHERVGKSQA
ncbi:MAG: nitroreductase family protein [Candidatus Binataceae bacterium]